MIIFTDLSFPPLIIFPDISSAYFTVEQLARFFVIQIENEPLVQHAFGKVLRIL